MRELKFRALNTDLANPEMEYFTIDEPYKFIRLKGKQFMQYTGLKDKNGTEIYKSDILKVVSSKRKTVLRIDEVDFHRGAFGLKDCLELWQLEDDFKSGEIYYEVIGNIYTNPELLES